MNELFYQDFKTNRISPDILFSNLKFLNVEVKNSSAFNDPKYLPFYYKLGKYIHPKSVIQIGSKLGIISSCFLKNCKSCENWTFVKEDPILNRIIASNVRVNSDVNVFFEYVCENKFDLALLTDEYNSELIQEYLEFLWNNLKTDGLLVVDYTNQIFLDFCLKVNRTPVFCDTRYKAAFLVK